MSVKHTAVGAAKSKLMWLGLLVLVLGQVQTNVDTLAQFIPAKWLGLFTSALGLAIMIARYFTDQSLNDKGAPDNETPNT